MNIKLHTPKSLKMGSGMSSGKQFLLSILATTVSIALTFGTAAIIDSNKKSQQKHEIVMMVMYDMYNSLKSAEQADSMIYRSMDIQRQIAEDTTRFATKRMELIQALPKMEYTDITERIFSSSIETINTVGNVLFTENVAKFYQTRKDYKEVIQDTIYQEVVRDMSFNNLKSAIEFDYVVYAYISSSILQDMQQLYAQCKKMMDITDEEIEAYRKERMQMEEEMSKEQKNGNSVKEKAMKYQKRIDAATEKLHLDKESE